MKTEFVQSVPLFAELDAEAQQLLAAALQEERHPKGTTLFRGGDPADRLYMVEQGFVRLLAEDGVALATLGPGSLLSEAEFLRGIHHKVTAVAASDVVLLSLSDQALRQLIRRHPPLGLGISQAFGEHVVHVEDYLVERLGANALLAELPQPLLRAMATRLVPVHLAPGELLYRVGESPRGLFLLESGLLELQPAEAQGTSSRVEPGQVFGLLSILTHKPYTATARALQDTFVWVLPPEDFQQLAAHYPALRRTLGRRVRSRLSPADQTQAVIRLAQTPLFAQMAPEDLHAIAQRLVLQHVPAGERIFRAGDPGDALYLVDEGEVELTAESPGGVLEEVARIGRGGFFGEMSLLTGRSHTENAVAVRDTNLWILYKADLDELVGQRPTIGATLNQVVAQRLAEEESQIDEARFRRFSIFAGLNRAELRKVAQRAQPMRYRAGEVIYRAGTPGDRLFLLEKGRVRMQPLAGTPGWLLGEGEIFGERSTLTNQLRGQHAVAESDVDVLTIAREDLEQLMLEIPALALAMTRALSQRIPESPSPAPAAGTGGPAAPAERGARSRPEPQPVQERPGSWFANLSTGAKLRLVLLILLLIYLIAVAAPLALRSLLGSGAMAADGTDLAALDIAEGFSTLESQALSTAAQDQAQFVALADQEVPPTPTYTPPPTNTPVPTPTPTITPTPTNTPTPLPTPTFTPVPPTPVPVVQEQAPEPPVEAAAAPPPALPARIVDPRIPGLGIQIVDAQVPSGQPYWRLKEILFEDEQEAGGKHHIFVEVLDENGSRVVGQGVQIFWPGGSETGYTEDKPAPEYAYNYPMFRPGFSYNVRIEGLPSDEVYNMGLGDLERRDWNIHVNYKLIFQRTIAP